MGCHDPKHEAANKELGRVMLHRLRGQFPGQHTDDQGHSDAQAVNDFGGRHLWTIPISYQLSGAAAQSQPERAIGQSAGPLTALCNTSGILG